MKQKTVFPKERFCIARAFSWFPWWTKLWQFLMSFPSGRWILPAGAQDFSPPCRAKGIWFCLGYCSSRPSKPGILPCEPCPYLRPSFSWCGIFQKLSYLYQVAGIQAWPAQWNWQVFRWRQVRSGEWSLQPYSREHLEHLNLPAESCYKSMCIIWNSTSSPQIHHFPWRRNA